MQQNKIPTIFIIGAGIGGLSFYHALVKNKDKKEFNVKIFERDSGPEARWQGFNMALNNLGIHSLINCAPTSVASNLPKAIPNPIPGVESHGISINDHTGNTLLKPPTKHVKDIYEIAKIPGGGAPTIVLMYRDVFREVLSENVPIQWGKKCTGYEETQEGVWVSFDDGSREFCDILVGADGINSPVRKQKIPELQIFDHGITRVDADIAVPQSLIDRLTKIYGNSVVKSSIGLDGDFIFFASRLIPVEQEKNNEPCYRATLVYSYPAELDSNDVIQDKIKVDDDDPASVIEHIKQMIRKLRPDCEVTNVTLELWDLVPKTNPNDSEKFPFKHYSPVRRRNIRDINPLSVSPWTSSRVTLLGDAAHAMSPVLGLGANNAIQDADFLSQALLNSSDDYVSSIEKYESEMLKRASAQVLKSRSMTLKLHSPVGFFGAIVRDSIYRVMDALIKFYSFVSNLIS